MSTSKLCSFPSEQNIMELDRTEFCSICIFQLWFKEQELIPHFLRENYVHSCEKLLRNIACFTQIAVQMQNKYEVISETSNSF